MRYCRNCKWADLAYNPMLPLSSYAESLQHAPNCSAHAVIVPAVGERGPEYVVVGGARYDYDLLADEYRPARFEAPKDKDKPASLRDVGTALVAIGDALDKLPDTPARIRVLLATAVLHGMQYSESELLALAAAANMLKPDARRGSQ